MADLSGAPPIVPNLTSGNGTSKESLSPLAMVAMMMGQRPPRPDSTTEKMSQIVQLLREVSKEDSRVALMATDALNLLVNGPAMMAKGAGSSSTPSGGPGQTTGGSSLPGGGPSGQQ